MIILVLQQESDTFAVPYTSFPGRKENMALETQFKQAEQES